MQTAWQPAADTGPEQGTPGASMRTCMRQRPGCPAMGCVRSANSRLARNLPLRLQEGGGGARQVSSRPPARRTRIGGVQWRHADPSTTHGAASGPCATSHDLHTKRRSPGAAASHVTYSRGRSRKPRKRGASLYTTAASPAPGMRSR